MVSIEIKPIGGVYVITCPCGIKHNIVVRHDEQTVELLGNKPILVKKLDKSHVKTGGK